jgi:membrane protein
MYGSLSTLVFALMWMYFCMIIVFLGAELNMFLTKKRSGDFGSWIEEL